MMVKMARLALLAALLLPAAGCFVEVRSVTDARAEIAQAKAEAQRLAEHPGRAHDLEVLVYDADEKKLIRARLPLWIVRKAADRHDLDFDLGEEVDSDLRDSLRKVNLAELEKAARGTLIEVEEDDGAHVLVWLR
jgi:hypothetical protein